MLRPVVVLAAAAVASTACSGGETAALPAEQVAAAATTKPAAAAKVLTLGQGARIKGEKGQPLTVTPLGVYYYRGKPGDSTRPAERWFAAVAIRVAAAGGADRMPPPVTGSLWRIRQGGRVFEAGGGNSWGAPWVGSVPDGVTAVAKGSLEIAIKTFDVPSGGGELQWVSNGAEPIRWRLPGRTSGKGLASVVAYMRNRSASRP